MTQSSPGNHNHINGALPVGAGAPQQFALPPGGMDGPPDFGNPHQQQVNLFKVLHGLFRGRYMLAAILSGSALVAGAAYAWFTNKPLYQSAGLIRVAPVTYDAVKGTTDPITFAESFVRTQAKLITADRVISKAQSSKAWQSLHIPSTPEEDRNFRNSLNVKPSRDELELINISFTHEDPQVAFTALTEICEAYNQLFVEFEDRDRQVTRERILRDEKRILETNIQQNADQLTDLANDLGTTDPAAIMDFGNKKLMEVDARILDLEFRLIAAGGSTQHPDADKDKAANAEQRRPGDPEPEKPATKDKSEMTYEEIAGLDPTMGQLLLQYHEVLGRKSILNDQGLGEKHIQMRNVNREVTRLENLIEAQRKAFVEGKSVAPAANMPPAFPVASPTSGGGSSLDSVASLEIQLQKLRAHKQLIVNENRILARRKRELENKTAQLNTDRNDLAQISQAIDQLRREREMMSSIARVELILPPRPESFPTVDKRFRNAVLYGGLGGMLPLMGIALYGLANRRFRYSDEAIEEGRHTTPMLGILPRLPSDLHDAEQAVAAAHCVHQIRTLVQISAGPRNKVIAVTSSNPGDGKTSMALALGYSFAGSGSKTLMVDLDLIGQGLSRGLKMREQSSVFRVMVDGDVRTRVRPTHMDNLFLLASGIEDDHRSANRLSGQVVSRFIAQVRDDYDIILIDTGPVLGSIEAHLVCAEADSVILVVGAGRARGQVKAAVDQLRRVRARLLGMVFNLAQGRDFRMSAASQSFRSVRPDGQPPQRPKPDEFPELEPLPRVVAIDTRK